MDMKKIFNKLIFPTPKDKFHNEHYENLNIILKKNLILKEKLIKNGCTCTTFKEEYAHNIALYYKKKDNDLYMCDDTFVATTLTDANGFYLFDGLTPGDYYVEFIEPEGYNNSLYKPIIITKSAF